MNMDLRDLEVFLAVVRKGSFGRAATDLLVTQPAVSERIRHLERVVGTPMFERTSRGSVLTAAGMQLRPFAERCLVLADEALQSARAADGVPRLVIAVHSTFAPRVVPRVLGTLRDMPRRVEVRDAHSHDVQALVFDGIADIGFVVPGSAVRGVHRVKLSPERVVCVTEPNHPLARQHRPTVAALCDSVLAVNLWGDGAEEFIDRVNTAGVEPWRVRNCADAGTAVALARDHGHVGFVSESSVVDGMRSGALRRVALAGLAQWRIRLDLLHRTRDAEDPVIRAVVAAVAEL